MYPIVRYSNFHHMSRTTVMYRRSLTDSTRGKSPRQKPEGKNPREAFEGKVPSTPSALNQLHSTPFGFGHKFHSYGKVGRHFQTLRMVLLLPLKDPIVDNSSVDKIIAGTRMNYQHRVYTNNIEWPRTRYLQLYFHTVEIDPTIKYKVKYQK